MQKVLCVLAFWCMASEAYAETAIVVSRSIPGFEIGSVVTANSADGTNYEISSDGEVAVTNADGLAFKASGKDGCFEIGIEQAYELYNHKVIFDDLKIRGRAAEDLEPGQSQWAGASLELSATISAGAGVEVCLKIERPIVLEPTTRTVIGPQNMVVTQFSSIDEYHASPRSRLEISAKIEAGGQLQAKLNAFCMDSFQEAPNEKNTYRPAFTSMSKLVDDVVRLLDKVDGNRSKVQCVWAARVLTDPKAYRRDAMAEILLTHANDNAWRRANGRDAERFSIDETVREINSRMRRVADSCPKLVPPCGADCKPNDKAYIAPMTASHARRMQTSLAKEIEKLGTDAKGGTR